MNEKTEQAPTESRPIDAYDLPRCPSCGGQAHGALHRSGKAYEIRCLKCPTFVFAPTAAEAIADQAVSFVTIGR